MKFLGIGETNELGDMYVRLKSRGHDVRVYMSDEQSQGVMDGMLDISREWRDELQWIRSAGNDGIILFETASDGILQDELRMQGYNVIGGSALGDRLESDRAYGQKVLQDHGIQIAAMRQFDAFSDAMNFVSKTPRRYVLKLNGTIWSSTSTYVGQLDSGEDLLAVLRATQRRWPESETVSFVIMEHLSGVEVGVGAFFNGQEFLRPANLDWEHKRFFPGDLGELTGEMGTVVTYRGAEKLFDATLNKMDSLLRSSGYCGYINLNTIVNADGVWPLEFTCRFGYPGFPILDSLQLDRWDDLFARMISRERAAIRTLAGFSVGVVITVPPFPYHTDYEKLGKGMPISFREELTSAEQDALHYGEVRMRDGQLETAGMTGYVAVVTGTGDTIDDARKNAYRVAKKIVIPNSRYRDDIGEKLVREDFESLRTLGWIAE